MAAERVIRRDEVEDSLRPLLPMLQSAIATARKVSNVSVIAGALPAVSRPAHQSRLSGGCRWMVIADTLAGSSWPPGCGVESTDADHNQGKYAFRFPLGIFTVKREAHRDDEQRIYLQERLDEMRDAPLPDGADHAPDLMAYLSVPHDGPVKVIVTHEALKKPMIIWLDELVRRAPSPDVHKAARGPRRRGVRSSRDTKESLPQGGGSAGSS